MPSAHPEKIACQEQTASVSKKIDLLCERSLWNTLLSPEQSRLLVTVSKKTTGCGLIGFWVLALFSGFFILKRVFKEI